MGDARADELLAMAAELERRDEEVAAETALVVELAERTEALRRRAAELLAQLDAIPAELAAIEQTDREAREAERQARADLQAAEARVAALESARRSKEEELVQALRTLQSARETVADALSRVQRLAARRSELHNLERALRSEAEGLAVETRDVAARIREAPRVSDAGKAEPGETLEEIERWGGATRAALFVVRGTLDIERERIVVEANVLAASVLGEEPGTNVALVRRRLEETLGA